jgi:hypothetical protein
MAGVIKDEGTVQGQENPLGAFIAMDALETIKEKEEETLKIVA